MNRRWAALLLTLAVHLLLASLYLAQRGAAPAAPSVPQRVFVTLLARHRPPPPPPPMPTPKPMQRAPSVRARPPSPLGPLPPPAVEAAPSPVVEATPVPAAVAAPSPPASAGDMLERARRAAGAIDHPLRGGAPLPLAGADTSQATRFEAALAGAWIDRSYTMTLDRYEAADGVVIERITRAGRSKCYMGSAVSSRPQAVSCPPPGSGWSRR